MNNNMKLVVQEFLYILILLTEFQKTLGIKTINIPTMKT